VHRVQGEDLLLFSCQPDRTAVQRRNGSPLSATGTDLYLVIGNAVR
jgi:hypothetical protein